MSTFNQHIDYRSKCPVILILELSQTEITSEHVDIRSFMIIPQVNSFILSACKTMAFKVLRHANATACGQKLTAVFLGEPTPVQIENPFGDYGQAISVHNQKCTSHCIDTYYLSTKKGFKINATIETKTY